MCRKISGIHPSIFASRAFLLPKKKNIYPDNLFKKIFWSFFLNHWSVKLSFSSSRWKSMGRLTNNLINRPNLINFVRQFCAPFQLMIRVHATWHVSSSLSLSLLPLPLLMHALVHDSLVSSLRANQFLPNENWLSGIRGTSPSFDASIERPSFFPSCSNFRFFFFLFFCRFRHRDSKIESNFYSRNEIVNAQLYNWGQFFSRTIICGISFLSLLV